MDCLLTEMEYPNVHIISPQVVALLFYVNEYLLTANEHFEFQLEITLQNCTTELNINKKIPSLDILTNSSNNDKFTASQYKTNQPVTIPLFLSTIANAP